MRRASSGVAGGLPVVPVTAAALTAALLVSAAATQVGPVPALALLAAAAAAMLLVSDARAALVALVLAFVVPEASEAWGVPLARQFHLNAVGPFTPIALTALLALAATLLEALRHGELRLPGATLGWPLMMVLAAFVFGMLNGALGGEAVGFAVLGAPISFLPLVLMPIVVVNALRTREQILAAVGAGALLAMGKAVLGLAVLQLGISSWDPTGTQPELTYYEPTPNWLMLAVLVGAAAAALQRVPAPWWLRWGWPLALACLLLSYRRSFWLATLLCLALVLVLAAGSTGRRVVVPALIVLAFGGFFALRAGIGPTFSGPLAERARSIDPSKVRINEQDRYRLAERRNVMAEIERRPLTGIGMAVEWSGRYPVPFSYSFGRLYVHLAALWWWLHCGVLGLIAYVWLLAAGVASGLRTFRRHPDAVIGIGALTCGIGLVGFAVVELSATIAGPEERGSLLLGLILGFLACAARDAGETAPAR